MKKISVLLLLAIVSILAFSSTTYASGTDIIGPDVIHKQSNHILTVGDILSLYSSEFGIVGIAEDNYTGYGNIVGIHTMQLYVSDGSTVYTKDIEIDVITDLGDVTCVADYKDIYLKTTQVLTPTAIVYILENTGYIEITATTQMMILNNTYTDNSGTSGQYLFEFRLVNSAGIDAVYTSIINVSDDENLFVPDITFVPDASTGEKVVDAFITILYILAFLGIGYVVFRVITKPRKKA